MKFLKSEADVIIMMLGTNDMLSDEWDDKKEKNFIKGYKNILKNIMAMPS